MGIYQYKCYFRACDQNSDIAIKFSDPDFLKKITINRRSRVSDSNIQTIPMEMQHISEWTMRHNLKLNETKSKEITISLLKTHIYYLRQLT